jgi:hypothetical protein
MREGYFENISHLKPIVEKTTRRGDHVSALLFLLSLIKGALKFCNVIRRKLLINGKRGLNYEWPNQAFP